MKCLVPGGIGFESGWGAGAGCLASTPGIRPPPWARAALSRGSGRWSRRLRARGASQDSERKLRCFGARCQRDRSPQPRALRGGARPANATPGGQTQAPGERDPGPPAGARDAPPAALQRPHGAGPAAVPAGAGGLGGAGVAGPAPGARGGDRGSARQAPRRPPRPRAPTPAPARARHGCGGAVRRSPRPRWRRRRPAPGRVLAPPACCLLAAPELQPPLYQPLTPSQYVSRWRPMWDRCFNIGSALIYSSCRSGFSALGLSPGGGGCGRSRPPPGPRAARPPGGRGGGEEGGAGESGAESGTSPSRSPAPIDNSLDQKLILFVQFIDQPKMAPGAAAATAAPGVGPHPGRPPGPAPPPPPPPPRDRGGGGPGGPRGARERGAGGGPQRRRCAGRGLRPGGRAWLRAPRPRPAVFPGKVCGELLWGVKRLPLQEEPPPPLPPARRSWGWWRCGAAGSGEGQSGHRRRRRRGPAPARRAGGREGVRSPRPRPGPGPDRRSRLSARWAVSPAHRALGS